MAVNMPGHGVLTALMSRMALPSTLWAPTVYIHPDVERFVRIAVAWRIFALRDKYARKPAKMLERLGFLPSANEIEIFRKNFRSNISDKEVVMLGQVF